MGRGLAPCSAGEAGPPPPRHLAIIPDGNGRWAQQRGLPRSAGHAAGAARVDEVLQRCVELGVRRVTLFAFSTENWGRDSAEVAQLWSLIECKLRASRAALARDCVRIEALGQRRLWPKSLQRLVDEIYEDQAARERGHRRGEELLSRDTPFGAAAAAGGGAALVAAAAAGGAPAQPSGGGGGGPWRMTLALGLSYGGRSAIADAAADLARMVRGGSFSHPRRMTRHPHPRG